MHLKDIRNPDSNPKSKIVIIIQSGSRMSDALLRDDEQTNMNKLFVISLGGSLIVPEEIDVKFLKSLKALIETQAKKGSRFIIITGGGKTCRKYQSALTKISKADDTTLDWLGIYSTRFNAQLIRLMFGKLAHGKITEHPSKKIIFKEKILIGAGWE